MNHKVDKMSDIKKTGNRKIQMGEKRMIYGKIYHRKIQQEKWIKSKTVDGLLYKDCWHQDNMYNNLQVGFTCISKFASLMEYPEFELLGPVEYLILEGSGKINSVICKKGDYMRIESGRVKAKACKNGCVVFCKYSNGIKLV